jgi:hypothetical protein
MGLDFVSGFQPSVVFWGWYLGLRPRLGYVGPLALAGWAGPWPCEWAGHLGLGAWAEPLVL